MINPIIKLVLILSTLVFVSFANSGPVQETLLECLNTHSQLTYPISAALYTPNNSSYASVLQSYIRNLRFSESRKPDFILTAFHVSHIQAAIICAKAHGLQMKIRSGGHDYEGISYVSDVPFFILDMFNLRAINVSIEEESAWVEAGATLGELYYRIAKKSNVHGFPAGICPTVAVGGHFTGGGYGNLMRKYGLSIDNIADAQVVDVNGRILDRASMGEDLFWAITGGGGSSFGVVLAYKIKLVRVPAKVTVFELHRTYVQNASNLAVQWQEIVPNLPVDIFMRMFVEVVNGSQPGEKTIGITFPALFLGDTASLLSLMNERFPELGLQQKDCTEMRWIESVLYWNEFPIGTPIDILLSRDLQGKADYNKRKSDYVKKPMTKAGWEYILKKMTELQLVRMQFSPYGGRMSEIPASAKPFPHRAGNIAHIQYLVDWDQPGTEAANHYINLIRALFAYMTPFVSNSPREAFFNYRDFDLGINHNGQNSYSEGLVYGVKYFKDNFNRLVQIKNKVDPDNFFRNEQSIPTLPSRRNSNRS